MERQDTTDVNECLRVCPLDSVACAKVCDRAAAVGARQRGLPFYVPFRQSPLEDWTTLFPCSPAGSNWQAFDAPNAAYAPWIKPTVPWDLEWNLSSPPLSATSIQYSNAQCHRACDAQATLREDSMEQGLGPLPGVYTGWNRNPYYEGGVSFLNQQASPFGEFLEYAMGPTASWFAAQLPPWQLSGTQGANSFRANHIPIHGQPVNYRQSLPNPLPARLN